MALGLGSRSRYCCRISLSHYYRHGYYPYRYGYGYYPYGYGYSYYPSYSYYGGPGWYHRRWYRWHHWRHW
jgi:hypothetical protein